MALPIKSTPALTGKTSKRFNQKLELSKSIVICNEEITKIRKITNAILAKAQ